MRATSIASALTRTAFGRSRGSVAAGCATYVIEADLAPIVQGDPDLAAGTSLVVPWFLRDPGDGCAALPGTGFSDALEVQVQP